MKTWPEEHSPEYRNSLGTTWAPSFTRVGRGRDIGAVFVALYVLALVVGAIFAAVTS